MRRSLAASAVALLLSTAWAQNEKCISLAGSTTCPAFNTSSISTDSTLTGLFPFLAGVSDRQDFDRKLSQYVTQGYVTEKYTNLFGCKNVNLDNTTNYYARYTTSFLCNSVIQNSRQPCGASGANTMPLCADSCAQLAISEAEIISTDQLCSGRNNNYQQQIRADYTNCGLPSNSLSASCIEAEQNEPNNCGFSTNLMGLCNYCRGSTENATDSCCVTSNASSRCQDVTIPVFSTASNLLSTSTSGSSSSTSTAASGADASSTPGASHNGGGHGLSGGAIAGIVVGSVLGFLLLLTLLIFCCILIRRRSRGSKHGSLLNQPSPQRRGTTSMSYNAPSTQQGYEVLPGGRVARMAALNDEPRNMTATTDPYGDSPDSREKAMGAMGAAGAMGMIGARKHDGSPSSNSNNNSSPNSNGDFSSPEGVASGQSEQLPFFKDYYSNQDIHPGDKVSTLWAYQPRAGDEFELERGDMLKIVGIWDDGWATGVRIDDRAEDYEGKHKSQRDSGVSNGSNRQDSPEPSGEIKAFPLVCVCLPDAWRKTVEGDTSTESGGSGGPPQI